MTYKAPNPKTNISPIFCRRGSCNCFNSGIGIENIIISVVIFRAAFENQNAVLSMQLFSMKVVQKLDTGMHMNVEAKTAQQPYTMRIAIMMLHNFAIFDVVNMRLY